MAQSTEEEQGQQDDVQLFPMGSIEGDGVSLKTFIRGNRDNKLTVKIKSTRVPSGSGLADPEKDRVLLVTCEPGKVETVPHKEEGKVVRYTTVQVYEPIFVEGVQRGDVGRMEAAFKSMLTDDPDSAAKMLDRMQAAASMAFG